MDPKYSSAGRGGPPKESRWDSRGVVGGVACREVQASTWPRNENLNPGNQDPEIQDLGSWDPAPKDCEFGGTEWGQPQDATRTRNVKCGTWIPRGQVTQQVRHTTHIQYIRVHVFCIFRVRVFCVLGWHELS